MVEKIGPIRNPLTIIAMFAAIAEISGTVVLPFISEGNQSTYIWFLIVFPLLLIVLFFLTLNFNHKVLYAPSDFKEEENFFKSFDKASPAEKAEKIREEVQQFLSEAVQASAPPTTTVAPTTTTTTAAPTTTTSTTTAAPPNSRQTAMSGVVMGGSAIYSLAEELALNKLSQEFGKYIERDVRFANTGRTFIFDGIIKSEDKITAIEIKYFKNSDTALQRFRDTFSRILSAAGTLPESGRDKFSLVIAVVIEEPIRSHHSLINQLKSLLGATPFQVEIRVYSLGQLQMEFGFPASPC